MAEAKTVYRGLLILVFLLTAAVIFLGYSVFQLNQRLAGMNAGGGGDVARLENPSEKKSESDGSPRIAPPLSLSLPEPTPHSLFDPGSWDPFQELAEMQERMEELFNNAFERFQLSPRFGNLVQGLEFNPRMDMTEDDKQYIIHLDIPGADAANLQVRLENNTLIITGTREKEEEQQQPSGRTLRRERRIGQFQRTITFPSPVKEGSLKSDYKDGVLTITVEKESSS